METGLSPQYDWYSLWRILSLAIQMSGMNQTRTRGSRWLWFIIFLTLHNNTRSVCFLVCVVCAGEESTLIGPFIYLRGGWENGDVIWHIITIISPRFYPSSVMMRQIFFFSLSLVKKTFSPFASSIWTRLGIWHQHSFSTQRNSLQTLTRSLGGVTYESPYSSSHTNTLSKPSKCKCLFHIDNDMTTISLYSLRKVLSRMARGSYRTFSFT